MVKLKEMVTGQIIDGFKGVIDFYYYMGIPVARKWPKKPSGERSPSVQAQWPVWAYITKHWNYLPENVRRAYKQTATGSSLTGRDLFTKSYIKTYFRDGQWD